MLIRKSRASRRTAEENGLLERKQEEVDKAVMEAREKNKNADFLQDMERSQNWSISRFSNGLVRGRQYMIPVIEGINWNCRKRQ
jgi:hypothetical protein